MSPESAPIVLPNVDYAPNDKEKAKRFKLLWKYETKRAISAIAMSASGHRLLMGCTDHYIYYFDKEKELIWDYNCLSKVICVAMNATGTVIAVGTEKHVLVLNSKGDMMWDNKVGSGVSKLLITDSGDLIVAGTKAHKIFFYDRTGKVINQHRTIAAVSNLCKSDNDEIIIATSEATIMRFNRDASLVWNYKTQWNIQTVTISGLGEIIVAGAMTSLYCLNNRRDLLWKQTGKNVAEVIDVSRSKDYMIIGTRDGILSSYNVMGDMIWQYRTGSVKATAKKVVTKGVTAARVNGTGQFIAVGSVNKNLYFLSREQELLYKFEAVDEVSEIVMSEVGSSMAFTAGSTVYFIENHGLYPLLFDNEAKKLKEAHSHKIEVRKAAEFYKAAANAYTKGNYEKASSSLMSADKQIGTEQKTAVKEVLSQITIKMAKAEVAGVDLSGVKGMLARSKEIYKEGGYYSAVNSFHQVINQLNMMVREDEPPKKEAAKKKIPAAPAATGETPTASEPTVVAVPATGSMPPFAVAQTIPDLKPVVEPPGAGDVRSEEAMDNLHSFESAIASLKRDGIDVTSLEAIAHYSTKALEKGDFGKSLELTAQGEREADQLIQRSAKRSALDLLSKITNKITQANSKGLDTSEYELIMAKAVKAFERNMFDESVGIIRKLDVDMDRVLVRASPRYEQVKNLIRKVEGEIIELKNQRMNAIEIEDMIEECWVHLDSDLDWAETLVQEAYEKLVQLKEQHGKIKEEFNDAQARIEMLEQRGHNTTGVQSIYHDALIVLYSGNVKKALEHLEQMKTQLEKIEGEASDGDYTLTTSSEDPLILSMKKKNAQFEEELILKTEEISSKDSQISELELSIQELEGRLEQYESIEAAKKECSACGSRQYKNSKFCSECGREFEITCPQCSTIIPEGFVFCGKCGTKIE